MMPVQKNRVFLVCRSKNCQEAKKAHVRCTLSVMQTETGMTAFHLNRRKFCTLYTIPEIVDNHNTPNWQESPDKPGERNKMQKAKKEEECFYVDNPDFLEV